MNEDRQRELREAERIARDVANSLGLEVVDFTFHSQGRHSLLRIDVDRVGPAGVALADCERLSRALDDRLDALSFFSSSYELQVSSPGIDRPIRTDDDFRRNAGRRVRCEYRDESGRVHEIAGVLRADAGSASVELVGDSVVVIPRTAIVLMKQDVSTAGRRGQSS
jgi:ribosome maturation factor RimP